MNDDKRAQAQNALRGDEQNEKPADKRRSTSNTRQHSEAPESTEGADHQPDPAERERAQAALSTQQQKAAKYAESYETAAETETPDTTTQNTEPTPTDTNESAPLDKSAGNTEDETPNAQNPENEEQANNTKAPHKSRSSSIPSMDDAMDSTDPTQNTRQEHDVPHKGVPTKAQRNTGPRRAVFSHEKTDGTRIPQAAVVAGAAILIAGGVGILGIIGYNTFFTGPTEKTIQISQELIAADQTEPHYIRTTSRSSIITSLRDAHGNIAPITAGDVKMLPLIESGASRSQIEAERLFSTLGTNAPASLIRSFTESYIYGVHGTRKTPFLVIRVDDHSQAFAGMLEWEDKLYTDLSPILYPTETPTTTPQGFTDKIIENNDARVLQDAGTTRIAYMFIEPTILVIGPNESTLQTVLQARRTAQKTPGE